MGTQRPISIAFFLTAVMFTATGCDTGTGTGGGGAPNAPGTVGAPSGISPAATAPAMPGPQPGRPIESERWAYAEINDQLVYGHFAFPEDMVEPLPAIIVIHESWGLNDSIRGMADRLAAQGYAVLAVDLFGGETATSMSGARALELPVIENPDVANENIRQAYQFFESGQAPSIAALGLGFGGNWALNTALLFPDELDAAVIYYGQVTNNEEKLEPLNVPILGLFGANDRGVTVATVREFEGVLESLSKEYDIEIYTGAGHAFADPNRSNYDAAVAEQAWARVLVFLEQHLRFDND